MRWHSLLLPALLALAACGTSAPPAADAPAPRPVLRTDGVYAARTEGLVQYLHFYPGGNVVTMNCLASVADSLKGTMRADLPADLMRGTHNVPYTVRGDSVVFRTTLMQGYMEYAGLLHTGDSITMDKYSTVAGRWFHPVYHFER
jgi:hypothetical protein